MYFRSELTRQKQHILKDVTFEVKKGTSLAILGESGSGKTTLGKILIGLLKPTSGLYQFEDKEPYKNAIAKKILAKKLVLFFKIITLR